MNRKPVFIIMLLFCLSTGAAACVITFLPDIRPVIPTVSLKPTQATLSAPVGAGANAGESEEAVTAELPAMPVLPEAAASETTEAATPETTEAGASEPSEPQYTYTASHSSQRLFIRDDASLRANIIGSLQPGESGEVISIGDAWVLLKHGELEGYVFKEYLSLEALPQ